MNSLTKVIVLAVVLYACVSSAAEEKKKERYSSFECVGYDKDHPDDLSMRNCILRDVIVASEKGQPVMLFYAREGQDTPLLSADKKTGKGRIVEIAPRIYASVKVLHEAIPENLVPVEHTAVLMSAQGNNLKQFLYDTFFGIYWMLTRTGDIDKKKPLVTNPSAVTVIEVGRSNELTGIVHQSISAEPAVPLRKVVGVLFSRVVAGPAGHLMLRHIKKPNSPVLPEEVQLYRSFFLKVAKVNDKDFEKTRIVLSHRFNNKRVINTEELYTAMNKIGSGQVAFLSQLSINSQIEIVSNSNVFVSTHSEDMVYILFIRTGKTVVEIMPYGIDSDESKKLADLCGVKYIKLANKDRSRAEFNEKVLDTFPLTAEQKKSIIEAEKYDPSMPYGALTYWESQDTKVDIEAFSNAVRGLIPPKDKQADEENEPIHTEL